MKMRDDELLAALWRFLQLTVHRYDNSRTGEVLVVMTIVILDRAGRNPTVSELASITGIPTSNVSRYVSHQLERGDLEEIIDPQNRRLRRLRPTEAGREEQEWLGQQISAVANSAGRHDREVYDLMVSYVPNVNDVKST